MSTEYYYCWYPVQIRFRDLDPLAHVNNTVSTGVFSPLKPFSTLLACTITVL